MAQQPHQSQLRRGNCCQTYIIITYANATGSEQAQYAVNTDASNVYAPSVAELRNLHGQLSVQGVVTGSYQHANGNGQNNQTNGNNQSSLTNGYASSLPAPYHEESRQQAYEEEAASNQAYGTHSLPTFTQHGYTVESTRYTEELSLEEEPAQDPTTSAFAPLHYPVENCNDAPVYGTNDSNVHGDPSQPTAETGGSISPTTRRWSAEPSSEERLRLGLPRYETEAQRRQAYERATRQI